MSDVETLAEAKEVILKLKAELERIAGSPLVPAIVTKHVVEEDKHFMYVSSRGSIVRVEAPKDKPDVGSCVLLFQETMQMAGKGDFKQIPLRQGVVLLPGDSEHCTVSNDGQPTVVLKMGHKVKEGDNVIIDQAGTVLIQNLGQDSGSKQHGVVNPPDVTWDMVGGLKEAKRQMQEVIEGQSKNKELYKHYGKKPIKGVLLYGPPGCGKTLLAKAGANALAKTYGGVATASGFMYIKGPELLNKYVGESEAGVRNLFTQAKAHKNKYGYPAIIFIDEADALLAARGHNDSTNASRMSGTIVPMFLTEMDGMEESSALVILATNRQDILDPAIVREGRIDRKIRIDRPEKKDAIDIMYMNLKGKPVHECTVKALSKMAIEALYDEKRVFYIVETKETEADVTLAEMVNGAMIAALADYALQMAIRRDLDNNTITGLTEMDVMQAVERIDEQNRDLDHTDMLAHLTDGWNSKVTNIRKVKKGHYAAEEAACG